MKEKKAYANSTGCHSLLDSSRDTFVLHRSYNPSTSFNFLVAVFLPKTSFSSQKHPIHLRRNKSSNTWTPTAPSQNQESARYNSISIKNVCLQNGNSSQYTSDDSQLTRSPESALTTGVRCLASSTPGRLVTRPGRCLHPTPPECVVPTLHVRLFALVLRGHS